MPAPAHPMILNQFFGSSLAFGFAPDSGTISNRTWRSRTVAPSSINVNRPSAKFAWTRIPSRGARITQLRIIRSSFFSFLTSSFQLACLASSLERAFSTSDSSCLIRFGLVRLRRVFYRIANHPPTLRSDPIDRAAMALTQKAIARTPLMYRAPGRWR